jgi:hypothetical protein
VVSAPVALVGLAGLEQQVLVVLAAIKQQLALLATLKMQGAAVRAATQGTAVRAAIPVQTGQMDRVVVAVVVLGLQALILVILGAAAA